MTRPGTWMTAATAVAGAIMLSTGIVTAWAPFAPDSPERLPLPAVVLDDPSANPSGSAGPGPATGTALASGPSAAHRDWPTAAENLTTNGPTPSPRTVEPPRPGPSRPATLTPRPTQLATRATATAGQSGDDAPGAGRRRAGPEQVPVPSPRRYRNR